MQEVQVLEATRTAPNSRGRVRSNPITVERIRVAAYVRVSTDDDDQLGSFESQKLYYEEKIGENPEWVNAGIFADEAIEVFGPISIQSVEQDRQANRISGND